VKIARNMASTPEWNFSLPMCKIYRNTCLVAVLEARWPSSMQKDGWCEYFKYSHSAFPLVPADHPQLSSNSHVQWTDIQQEVTGRGAVVSAPLSYHVLGAAGEQVSQFCSWSARGQKHEEGEKLGLGIG
jgi:hypothetical protein